MQSYVIYIYISIHIENDRQIIVFYRNHLTFTTTTMRLKHTTFTHSRGHQGVTEEGHLRLESERLSIPPIYSTRQIHLRILKWSVSEQSLVKSLTLQSTWKKIIPSSEPLFCLFGGFSNTPNDRQEVTAPLCKRYCLCRMNCMLKWNNAQYVDVSCVQDDKGLGAPSVLYRSTGEEFV